MYNTDINILGGIPDYSLIYAALPLLVEGKDDLHESLVKNNEFDFRTERSRIRFFTLLTSAFISDKAEINELSSQLIQHLGNDEKSRALVLFWLFSLNNKLFYELNRDVFLKYFFQGRAELPKSDVIAYLKDKLATNEEMKGRWTESTINTVAYKYLSVLKRLHLLEGVKKKTFCFVRVSDEMLAVFVHFYTYSNRNNNNILEDEFFSFSLIPKENTVARLKKIGKKDWIKMNYTGTSLRVEGSYKPNEIIDGIFRRA
ncbi:DUF1819 family protein [Salinimicrobium sp. CDJ15-81-2]|nr:DUF1819 family protein [Salinimicrobium nanhaiense]